MPNYRRTQIRHLGLMLFLGGLLGCGNLQSESSAISSDGVAICLPTVQLNSTLTADEITALVAIAKELPGGALPQFVSVPGSQSLYSPLSEFVAAEQQRLAASLDPHWQAAQWRQDPELSRSLDALGVDPVNLATSMLRVSSAWTALLLKSSESRAAEEAARPLQVPFLEHCLARQLELTRALFDRPMTEWQREQQLEAVRETLACLQLARMCASVPEENLNAIARHRELVQPLLPAASSLSGFERRTESQATILRVSADDRTASSWQ